MEVAADLPAMAPPGASGFSTFALFVPVARDIGQRNEEERGRADRHHEDAPRRRPPAQLPALTPLFGGKVAGAGREREGERERQRQPTESKHRSSYADPGPRLPRSERQDERERDVAVRGVDEVVPNHAQTTDDLVALVVLHVPEGCAEFRAEREPPILRPEHSDREP